MPEPVGNTRMAAAPASTATETQRPVFQLFRPSGTLRLRGQPQRERHIRWADNVVFNEDMGKKSSKVCCIYHKPRPVDESSDDSSDSSSDSDSDSDLDTGEARPANGQRAGQRRNTRPDTHDHNSHGRDQSHGHDSEQTPSQPPQEQESRKQRRQRKAQRTPSPNAYEKVPKRR